MGGTKRSNKRDKPRHSANFKSGQPKRQGVTTWGSIKNDIKYMDEVLVALDKNDPNYASDDDYFDWKNYKFSNDDDDNKGDDVKVAPEVVTKEDFKKKIQELLSTYLASSKYDLQPLIKYLRSFSNSKYFHEVSKIAVSLCLDFPVNKQKQIYSVLLPSLYKKDVLTETQIFFGLVVLVNRIEQDLIHDVPNVVEYLLTIVSDGLVANKCIKEQDGKFLVEVLQGMKDCKDKKEVRKLVKERCIRIWNEYFVTKDLDEASDQVYDLFYNEKKDNANNRLYEHLFIKYGILLSLDKTNIERELVSELFGELTHDLLNPYEVEKGCEQLLYTLEDIAMDFSKDFNLNRMIACFIARLIVDEAIPPKFLTRVSLSRTSDGGEVVRRTLAMLALPHSSSRISHIWGSTDYTVADLKKKMKLIAKEYFTTSKKIDEAVTSLNTLSCPQFHHEFVKQLFILMLDYNTKENSAEGLLFDLYKALHGKQIVSAYQFEKGFRKVEERLTDLKIDVPLVESIFKTMKEKLTQAKILK